jgi:hypothetical protein
MKNDDNTCTTPLKVFRPLAYSRAAFSLEIVWAVVERDLPAVKLAVGDLLKSEA